MSRNSLDQEISAYLLSHKDNPVHWRPWSPDVLAEAEATGKPILLSIGYMACQWCHNMNKESFSDPETAALINDNYIPVLVDREERPDIDQIYQSAAHNAGHSGGWPLTMFLTAKGTPFHVGGYFPFVDRDGMVAFKTILADAARTWSEQREAAEQAAGQIEEGLAFLWKRDLRGQFHPRLLDEIAVHYGQRFDIFFGGVTGAPKFPSTGLIEALWRAYLRSGLEQFNQLVRTSLNTMCIGALFDHVGGGFMHYCVDERWQVPNFEKMLYDNAQIVDVLTMAWQATRAPLYRDRIAETITWVLRDMRSEKAFASSVAANTDGEEGRYYVWSEAEIDAALKDTYSQRFKEIYSVTRDGNFNGKNVLTRMAAPNYPLPEADEAMLARQRGLLLAARAKRDAPMRDDTVLADSNGLMIAALANAGHVFRNQDWINAAVEAFDFITTAMADGDKLFHSWRAGKRGHTGFAEDYALMARAALVLHEATGEDRYLDRAKAWTRTLNLNFWSEQDGGYYTAADGEDGLFIRARMIFDQVMPAANGSMVATLVKLFMLTGDESYRERSNKLVETFAAELVRSPVALPGYVNSIDTLLLNIHVVVIGDRANSRTQELVQAILTRSLPARQLTIVASGDDLPEKHPAHGKQKESGQPTAYICQNGSCSSPIINPMALSQALILPPQLAAQVQAQMQAQAQQQGQVPPQPANNPGPMVN